MKKKILLILLLLIMPVMVLCGCASEAKSSSSDNEHLFVAVDYFYVDSSYDYHVLVNKRTRVMYLSQDNGGIVVMVDAEGKPLLWKGDL